MKKLLAVMLTLALTLALALPLAGCTLISRLVIEANETPAPEQTEAGDQIPNPMLPVDDASAFSILGITMDAPDGATDAAYFIINESLAQVSFTFEGYDYTYRASATQSDISGVYDTFTDAFTISVQTAEAIFDATVQNAAAGGRLAAWSQGGVNYTLWCALAPDDAALKACVLGVLAKTFGEVSEQAAAVAAPVNFTQAKTLDMDLNGDGALEHVSFEPALDDQGYILTTNVRIVSDDGSDVFVTTELVCDPDTAIAYDIDDDGLIELFISGDMCSCDYETWVLRYDAGAIVPADACYTPDYAYEYLLPAAFGSVESIENGVITIGDTIDILGSWWCTTQYRIAETGFALERVPGSIWSYDYVNYDAENWQWAAITSAEFPVTIDGSGETSALPVGTKLIPIDTDAATYLHFITQDGITGVINVAFNSNGWGWSIDGVDEFELFSNEPYAG